MMAIAIFKICSRICAVVNVVGNMRLSVGPVFPRRVGSRWPALMFVVSRTAWVPGRIRIPEQSFSECLNLKDGTDRLSRNVGK
jgi:hypothetical protein